MSEESVPIPQSYNWKLKLQEDLDIENVAQIESQILLHEINASFPNLPIVTRTVNNKVVLMYNELDVILFDEIVAWRRLNPKSNMFEAFKHFADRIHADAIVKIAYDEQLIHWDVVIRYSVKDDSKQSIAENVSNLEARNLFIVELLKKNIFLEFEMFVPKDDMRFMKIMGSFDQFASEATLLGLRFQLTRKCLAKHLDAYKEDKNGEQQHTSFFSTFLKRAKSSESTNVPLQWETPANLLQDTSFNPNEKRSAAFQLDRILDFKGGDFVTNGMDHVKLNFFSNSKRAFLMHSILTHVGFVLPTDEEPVYLSELLAKNIILDFYAVHDGPFDLIDRYNPFPISNTAVFANNRALLYKSWIKSVSVSGFFGRVSVQKIRDYWGETTGFYFAWLTYLNIWILALTLAGLATFITGLVSVVILSNQLDDWSRLFLLFDNAATPIFAFFLTAWSILFLKFWKRQQAYLAFIWDTWKIAETSKIRPQWKPTGIRKSPVTGAMELHRSTKSLVLSHLATLVVIGFMFLFLVAAITGLIALKAYLRSAGQPPAVATAVSALFSVFMVFIFTPMYRWCCKWLNDKENYKYDFDHRNKLIWKNFVLSFTNNYGLLMFTSILKPIRANYGLTLIFTSWRETCEPHGDAFYGLNSCVTDLVISVFIVIAGLKIFSQAAEIVVPYLWSTFQKILNQGMNLREAVSNDDQPPSYIADADLNDLVENVVDSDYATKVIDLGYLLMFSVSLPIAPFIHYCSNLAELRLDFWKRLTIYKRSFSIPKNNIGAWQSIAEGISALGILTSSLILAFNSSSFTTIVINTWARSQSDLVKISIRIGFVIFYQNAAFVLQVLISRLIPEESKSVRHGKEAENLIEKLRAGDVKTISDVKRISRANSVLHSRANSGLTLRVK